MNPKIEVLAARLKTRLEFFGRIPSATNLIMSYMLMEEIILKTFMQNSFDINSKAIDKFDKLKNLAVSTKFIEEIGRASCRERV